MGCQVELLLVQDKSLLYRPQQISSTGCWDCLLSPGPEAPSLVGSARRSWPTAGRARARSCLGTDTAVVRGSSLEGEAQISPVVFIVCFPGDLKDYSWAFKRFNIEIVLLKQIKKNTCGAGLLCLYNQTNNSAGQLLVGESNKPHYPVLCFFAVILKSE